jgi:hypothetical protein
MLLSVRKERRDESEVTNCFLSFLVHMFEVVDLSLEKSIAVDGWSSWFVSWGSG